MARRSSHTDGRSRWTRGMVSAAVLVASVAACGDAAPSAEELAPVVRDSAGITIVENPPVSAETVLAGLGPEPELDIGVLEGDEAYQLFRVGGAALLSNGRVAVLDGGSNQLRIFSAEGEHLASYGGPGEGPGEFMSAQALHRWPGDSLAVWDGRLRRITLFADDGAMGRFLTLPASIEGAEDVRSPALQGVLDDGSLVVQNLAAPVDPVDGMVRIPIRVVVLDDEGMLKGDVGEHPGRESYMRVSENAIQIFRSPLSRTWVLEAVGDRVMATPNERLELRFWREDGTLDRIVRLSEPLRPLTDQVREAELAARTRGMDEQQAASTRRAWDQLVLPDTVPALGSVMSDRMGRLWVQPFRLEQQTGPVSWIVLDGEGRALGRVELPADFDVFDIGADYVLGLTRDDFDVEHVQLWRLIR